MDGERFDTLARRFGAATSRRQALKLFAGGIVASLGLPLLRNAAGVNADGGTSCTGTLSGTIQGNVDVPAGAVCTLTAGTHITGTLSVEGALIAASITVDGNLQGNHAAGGIWLVRSTVRGNLEFFQTTGVPPARSIGGTQSNGQVNALCGNAIGGNLSWHNNGPNAPLSLGDPVPCGPRGGNIIGGNLDIHDNDPVTVSGNTIDGNFSAHNNQPPISGTPGSNSVGGMATGEAGPLTLPISSRSCVSTYDCPGGLSCSNGACVSSTSPARILPCTSQADCVSSATVGATGAGLLVCSQGFCVAFGTGATLPGTLPPCRSDGDCGAGARCNAGKCQCGQTDPIFGPIVACLDSAGSAYACCLPATGSLCGHDGTCTCGAGTVNCGLNGSSLPPGTDPGIGIGVMCCVNCNDPNDPICRACNAPSVGPNPGSHPVCADGNCCPTGYCANSGPQDGHCVCQDGSPYCRGDGSCCTDGTCVPSPGGGVQSARCMCANGQPPDPVCKVCCPAGTICDHGSGKCACPNGAPTCKQPDGTTACCPKASTCVPGQGCVCGATTTPCVDPQGKLTCCPQSIVACQNGQCICPPGRQLCGMRVSGRIPQCCPTGQCCDPTTDTCITCATGSCCNPGQGCVASSACPGGCCDPTSGTCGCASGLCCANGQCVAPDHCPSCTTCQGGQCVSCAQAGSCCVSGTCQACPSGQSCATSGQFSGQCVCSGTGEPPVNGQCGNTPCSSTNPCTTGCCYQGQCVAQCPGVAVCSNGVCACPGRGCGFGGCCAQGMVCVGGNTCCPSGQVCSGPSGTTCCAAGGSCVNGVCSCPSGTVFCSVSSAISQRVCCPGTSCSPCGGCPAGFIACGGACCTQCLSGQCFCPPGSIGCGFECCPAGMHCTDTQFGVCAS